MFELEESWTWDFWTARDGSTYHLWFLQAPRSLGDPDLRHVNASVGHAVSTDLATWRRTEDALGPQPAPAYDDLATWTGSVVQGDDRVWRMFTSGISGSPQAFVQGIGVSTSEDLVSWRREPGSLVVPDPRWYADLHWRDPWVVRDDDGLWHLYVTAGAVGVAPDAGGGVVGHAVSTDLEAWEVVAPLSEPTGRFDQLEVVTLARVEGRWVLLFSCLHTEMPGAGSGAGGVWAVPVDGPGAAVDVRRAERVTSEDLYVGKVETRVDGTSGFLAFENRGADGTFRGGLTSPLDIGWDPDTSRLRLSGVPTRWLPEG